MRGHERITLNDNFLDVILKLSEGNPGAVRVLSEVIEVGSEIDPMNALGPLGPMLSLDSYGIYGSKIWLLYEYVCKQDIVLFIGVLRAAQLGLISDGEVSRAIDAGSLDVYQLMRRLKERLPSFRWEDDNTNGNDGVTADLE